jgi:tetratricopeptide (TPR) repeat protein/tRNA A-37 threonylcarbamoyl transferase component Bud32
MNEKDFLKYLVVNHKISKEQAKQCWQECASKNQRIAETLIKGGYFTPAILKQYAMKFRNSALKPLLEKSEETPIASTPEENLLEKLQQFSKREENTPTPSHGTLVASTLSKAETDDPPSQKITKTAPIMQKERYEVLQTLGEGGMGVVQLVKDNLLGREVALKKIKTTRSHLKNLSDREKAMLWRLNKEAEITAILEHPNIVPLYEMQQEKEGEICFTMRKVEGRTLRKILKAKREGDPEYDESKILGIYLKVCDAMAYAHSSGVVHRDLKPDNIMVGQFGEVYVMDWGIAKKLNQEKNDSGFQQSQLAETIDMQEPNNLHPTTVVEVLEKTAVGESKIAEGMKTQGGMGTEGYMAPEQRENASKVTPQSDIYSLGQILRECFVLLSPMEEFEQQIEENTVKRKLTKRKRELQKKSPEKNIPKEIKAIIEKATKTEPIERYESVKELSQDLESYQKHLRVSVKEYSSLELVLKWIQRYKQQIRLVGVPIIVLLITIFGYSEWKQRKEIQQNVEEAKEREKEANEIRDDLGKEKLSTKIGKLLLAQNFLNVALFVNPKNREVQEMKWNLGKKLVETCYLTEDYNLATFMAKEMETLSFPKKEDKDKLLGQVNEERDKTLKDHLTKFDELEDRFRNKNLEYGQGERDDAIFEISKMPEKEIFDKLIGILKEATEYFQLDQTKQDIKTNEFYTMMVMALGRLENPEAGPHLIESLESIKNKLSLLSNEEQKKEKRKMDFMILLAEAFANSKAFKYALKFYDIRLKMGINGLFWNRTETICEKSAKDVISDFNKTIQLYPQDATTYYYRAVAKSIIGDLEGAISDYNEAAKLNPKLNNASSTKNEEFNNFKWDFDIQHANIYLDRAITKEESGDFEGAITDYNKSIELNPKLVRAYNGRGNAKEAKEDLDGALADYNKAIELNPKDDEAYNNKGDIEYEKGNLDESIDNYTKAIKYNPQSIKAYNNRGNVKLEKGKIDEAITDFDEAIHLDSKFSDTYNYRGSAKEAKEDLDGALADYNKAIELNPKDDNAYNNRGLIKWKNGDIEGAIFDINEAIRLNPNGALGYNNRGLAKMYKGDSEGAMRGILTKKDGDLEGAIADFNKAIDLDPQCSQAFSNRGLAKMHKGDYQESIKDYTEAIHLNPKKEIFYNNRGNAKTFLENFEGAIIDYTEAIRLNPEYANAYYCRGNAKYNKNDFSGAIKDYTETIRLNPEFPEAYRDRGTLRKHRGDLEGAIADFTILQELNPTIQGKLQLYLLKSQLNKQNKENNNEELENSRGLLIMTREN